MVKIDYDKLALILVNKRLYQYFDYVKQQYENGKPLDKIFDEIYEHEKSQTKWEAGIKPNRTLPNNIFHKNTKISVTTTPTPGEMEIHAGNDDEIDISCHEGYEGAKKNNKIFCQTKDPKV